jgi:integrase
MTTTKGKIGIEELHAEMVEIKNLLKANLELGGIGPRLDVGEISEKLEKAPQLTLELALERYLTQKRVEVSPQHLESCRLILRKFSRSLPAAQLSGVQKKDVVAFKDALLATGVSPKTVNNNLSSIAAFYVWAIANGLCAENVAKGLNVKVTNKAQKQRDAFTDEQIEEIFSGLLEGREASAKAWIPLIMAFSGARPEEVAQMRVRDVRKEGEQWVFDFETMDEGLRRKNEASRRLVPVHPRLFELGLEKLMDAGQNEPLFRDLTMGTTGRLSAAPGRFFNRTWLRAEKGISNKKLVLYSLRHTITTKLLHAGVSESLISQLVGHSNSSMTSGRYGKSYPLKHLAEALEKLDWSV